MIRRIYRGAAAVLFVAVAAGALWGSAVFLHTAAAMAQAIAADPDTTVTVPWGDLLSSLLLYGQEAATVALLTILAAVTAKLPAWGQAIIGKVMTEQLLRRAIDYAFATTRGAVKDQQVTVDIGNELVAKALRYALEHGSGSLVKWMGGEEKVAEKIIARLDTDKATALNPQTAVLKRLQLK